MELKQCPHEPDPDTVKYDKKYGRKAICKLCGKKIYMTHFVKLNKENTGEHHA